MSQTEAKNAIISYILKNMKSFKLQCVCDLCVCVCVCVCVCARARAFVYLRSLYSSL